MRLKILCFGDNVLLKQAISSLRMENQVPSEEEIVVEGLEINGKQFVIFSISNHQLIRSQAAGTNGILYFLSTDLSIFQQKDLLFGIFSERPQFEGLPIAIAFDKEQNLSLKEIVSHFELFKVKDRASMIKQIDLSNVDTVKDIFHWIDQQAEFRRTRVFDAQPKVVKMKPKYRDSEPESTQKKYQEIVKEKKFKGIGVKDQEQAYISKERERIKNQNMEKQLSHFNKNKKKMAPYDIKATPNPRIQANLHFFLKDPQIDKGAEVNIKIQTDQFQERPPEKPYIPKKTGINISTQIEQNELFDFDKQVQPILDILTTRALQKATLEIEEEEETLKILKYKNAFNERLKKQKKHEQEKIQAEIDTIKDKQRLLSQARKKDQIKKNIVKKVTNYTFANKLLTDIYGSATSRLFTENYFASNLQTQIRTQFLSGVFKKSMQSYQKIFEKKNCVNTVFEQQCIKSPASKSVAPKIEHEEKKKRKAIKRINKGDKERYVHLYYEHSADLKFSSFAKYIEKQFEGTLEEYVAKREEQIQEAEDKFQTGEIEQNQMNEIKEKDNTEFASNHRNFLIDSNKSVCYSLTSNKYEKPQADAIVGGALFFNKQFNLMETFSTNQSSEKNYVEIVNDLRYFKDQVNFDDGIVVNLSTVPDKVKSIIFYSKFNNVERYLNENEVRKVKFSHYGLEFSQKSISIHSQNIGEKLKWEQLVKAPGDGEQKLVQEVPLYVISYQLVRKGSQLWTLEEVRFIQKPVSITDTQFIEKIENFYKNSQQIFKIEEQEEKKVKTPSRNKRRSKKNIVEETPRKIQIKISTRILKEVKVDLTEDYNTNFLRLSDEVIEWKQFVETCPDGWQIHNKNGKISNIQDLIKFKKVGDLVIKRVPPPKIQEKVEEEDKQKDENDDD